MSQLYDLTAHTVRWIYDRRIATPPTLDEEVYFPEAISFAENWRAIRDEALTVANALSSVPRFHELMQAQAPISDNDGRDWRVFVLRAYGIDIAPNLQRCPVTAALVSRCPSVLSASFSFLEPGKHIPRHRGPFRGIVRCHVGLSMPRDENGWPGAILWIDGVEHRLDDGDFLVWDDTYPHEVLNSTGDLRVALLLDIWRQGMPVDMSALSWLICTAVRLGLRLQPSRFGG
ncbi:MAG TPA: aspartyl/asparaginyl beta-hydroxylase domain-containing protein [Rhizomicrobium sp.]|jgi:aspartate beta-hydroxylase